MVVDVRRRNSNATRNALNEPGYGAETSWTIAYSGMNTRIEYVDEQMQFLPTGERVALANVSTVMYVEPEFVLQPEDRITITSSDSPNLIGQLYIVLAVYPEWNSMGNVHHFIVEVQVH